MIVTLATERLESLEQVWAFVEGREGLDFTGAERSSRNDFVRRMLGRSSTTERWARARGLPRRFLLSATAKGGDYDSSTAPLWSSFCGCDRCAGGCQSPSHLTAPGDGPSRTHHPLQHFLPHLHEQARRCGMRVRRPCTTWPGHRS